MTGQRDLYPPIRWRAGPPWSPYVRRFFDPDHYRLIAFDQRGSWRSTPLGELRDNAHRLAEYSRRHHPWRGRFQPPARP